MNSPARIIAIKVMKPTTIDATGNRTDNTMGDHNRLLDDGTDTYEYDNEGNRTRRVETATDEVIEYAHSRNGLYLRCL